MVVMEAMEAKGKDEDEKGIGERYGKRRKGNDAVAVAAVLLSLSTTGKRRPHIHRNSFAVSGLDHCYIAVIVTFPIYRTI